MIGSTSSMVTRMQASAALRRSCRGLASISMSSSATGSSSAPAPASASASSSSASSWKPPIAPGVEPAYDEALKIISDFQSELKQKIPALKSEVERSEPATQQRAEAEVKLNSYLVASQVNDPEVRWRFENDEHVPLSNPVFAYLREKGWRQSHLPRAIERIQLMKVVPDALPSLTPTADVRVSFGQGGGISDRGGEGGDVLIGCFVGADMSIELPSISITPFHSDERLYTVALVDVDAPYEQEDRLGSFAHWLVHNIPLSLTKTVVDIKPEHVALPYIPPHPQHGTDYHRYCLVVLEQENGALSLPDDASNADVDATQAQRQHFSVHDMIRQHDLRAAGVHFWRAKWSKETSGAISSVYKDVLKQEEPHFGVPPRRKRW